MFFSLKTFLLQFLRIKNKKCIFLKAHRKIADTYTFKVKKNEGETLNNS